MERAPSWSFPAGAFLDCRTKRLYLLWLLILVAVSPKRLGRFSYPLRGVVFQELTYFALPVPWAG